MHYLLVIHKNIAALYVSMEEILLVAIVETIKQLSHDGSVVLLRKLHHPRLQQAHQVMVHVFKHQVERSLILKMNNWINSILSIKDINYIPHLSYHAYINNIFINMTHKLIITYMSEINSILLVCDNFF